MSHGPTVIAIDVGGTKVAAALVTSAGDQSALSQVITEASSAPALVKQLEALISELMGGADTKPSAIGVGLPGVVDSATGTAVKAANLPFKQTKVGPALERAFRLPVFLDNDANAGALGEKWFGDGIGISDFMFVSVGTGVGSGIVVNHRLLSGHQGRSPELGHTIIDPNGPQCGCGSRGCIEALAAGPAIAARFTAATGKAATARDVIGSALAGDQDALEALRESVAYLGIGIANAWQLLAPQKIILGGGVALAGEILLDLLSEEIPRLTTSGTSVLRSLSLSRLKGTSGVLGAASLAFERLSSEAGTSLPLPEPAVQKVEVHK